MMSYSFALLSTSALSDFFALINVIASTLNSMIRSTDGYLMGVIGKTKRGGNL